MNLIRTVLVDDHPSLRSSLRTVLARTGDIDVVATTESPDALMTTQRSDPDVVVVGVTVSPASQRRGLELIGQLHRLHPTVASVALTTRDDAHLRIRTALAGARGYVVKSTVSDELVAMIHHAYYEQRGGRSRITLTDDERRLLLMIAGGLTNPQLAAALGIGEPTVRASARRLLSKLDVSSRAEAIYAATKRGLI